MQTTIDTPDTFIADLTLAEVKQTRAKLRGSAKLRDAAPECGSVQITMIAYEALANGGAWNPSDDWDRAICDAIHREDTAIVVTPRSIDAIEDVERYHVHVAKTHEDPQARRIGREWARALAGLRVSMLEMTIARIERMIEATKAKIAANDARRAEILAQLSPEERAETLAWVEASWNTPET